MPRAERLGGLLKRRGETIAVAESSAGGLVSAALLAITEKGMAGLRPATEPYATLLARTARERFAVDWGIAETAAAGPGGNRYGDAAGHVCLAIAGPESLTRTLATGDQDRKQYAGLRGRPAGSPRRSQGEGSGAGDRP